MSAVIDNAESLDALPLGTVLLDRDGDTWMHDGRGWWITPETTRFSSRTLLRKWSPLRLIYSPAGADDERPVGEVPPLPLGTEVPR